MMRTSRNAACVIKGYTNMTFEMALRSYKTALTYLSINRPGVSAAVRCWLEDTRDSDNDVDELKLELRHGVSELWRYNDFKRYPLGLQLDLYLFALQELEAQLADEKGPIALASRTPATCCPGALRPGLFFGQR